MPMPTWLSMLYATPAGLLSVALLAGVMHLAAGGPEAPATTGDDDAHQGAGANRRKEEAEQLALSVHTAPDVDTIGAEFQTSSSEHRQISRHCDYGPVDSSQTVWGWKNRLELYRGRRLPA